MPRIQLQSVHYGSYSGWQHYYQCQQRQAGRANECSTYLDVYGVNITIIHRKNLIFDFLLILGTEDEEEYEYYYEDEEEGAR